MRPKVAQRKIESFTKRFGQAHLILACHAAFPLALTPDLVYRLWANFQQDIEGKPLYIPWVAVADLLLSSLCHEVGYELYEMNSAIREILLNQLKENKNLGKPRLDELSDFLLAYIRQQLISDDPDIKDLAQAQEWTALAYTRPSEAARQLALKLSRLSYQEAGEFVRVTSIIKTLVEPLGDEFKPLLIYAQGMVDFVEGKPEEATEHFEQFLKQNSQQKISDVFLKIPDHLISSSGNISIDEQVESKNIFLREIGINDKTIKIYEGDITNLTTDVIVTSDDNSFSMKHLISQRILTVGGKKIYEELKQITGFNTLKFQSGEIVATTAGNLKAKKVYHAVIIGAGNLLEKVKNAIDNSLYEADNFNYSSIAFPLLGAREIKTKIKVLRLMLEEFRVYLQTQQKSSIQEIIISTYFGISEKDTDDIINKIFEKLPQTTLALPDESQPHQSTQNSQQFQDLERYIKAGDRYSQARIYYQLAMVAQEQRHFDEAITYYQQALNIDLEKGNRYNQGKTYYQLGLINKELNNYTEAETFFQQALNIYQKEGNHYNQGKTYYQLGLINKELNNYAQAEAFLQQALLIEQEEEDRQSQANTYHNLGSVAQELKQWEQALSYYQKALEIFIENSDRHSQAITYHQLGRVAQELKQWEQALLYYRQALEIFIECSDHYSQGRTYYQLGKVARQLKEWKQALSYYQKALKIFIENSDRYFQGRTYHQLGKVAQQLREWEQALSYYQKALEIFIEYGDCYFQGRNYYQLGRVKQDLREWEQALSYYRQALEIFIKYSDRYFQAITYHQLGMIAQELKQWEQALLYYRQALELKIEFSDRYSQAITYHQLGLICNELNNYGQAEAFLKQALEIFQYCHNEHEAAMVQQDLENLK